MKRFDNLAVDDAVKTRRSALMGTPGRTIVGTVVAVTKTTFDVKWPDGTTKKYMKSTGNQHASSGFTRSRIGVIGYASYMEDETALLKQDAERFSKLVQLRTASEEISEKMRHGRLPANLFSDESVAKAVEDALAAVKEVCKAFGN